MKRCENGTRKNKKTGDCEKTIVGKTIVGKTIGRKRCQNGTRKNKKTGECDDKLPRIKQVTSPVKQVIIMNKIDSKLRIMYAERQTVSDETFAYWRERNSFLKKSKDSLFISKIKTMKLTKGITEGYIRVSGNKNIENESYIACGGNMTSVAQLILSEILEELTKLYRRGELVPEKNEKLKFKI